MCKKLIKNSQLFGKNCQKTAGGIFWPTVCVPCTVCRSVLCYVCTYVARILTARVYYAIFQLP